jgi:AcrR family transcriptional regulator
MPPRKRSTGTEKSSEETRQRLLDAADEVLREKGYAGASARTIATAAGVTSALVFYHFGGVDQLLLAALDRDTAERMEAHDATMAEVRTVEEFAAAAVAIYRTDLERGSLAKFSEMVAAAVTNEDLRKEITERAEPWLDFVAEHWERVTRGTALGKLLPARDVANAALTFYLGVNLFSVIDADRRRTEDVFALAQRLAPRAKLLTMKLPGRR